MPEFYIRPMFDRKIFFRAFFVKGGAGQRPSPVSYAYGWAPGPPPAKSGPASLTNRIGDRSVANTSDDITQ